MPGGKVGGAVCQELAPSKILLSPAPASHSEEFGESIRTNRGGWAGGGHCINCSG
jgi:hypothetical protein